MYDATATFDYMPSQWLTFRWEMGYRHSDVPYWSGRGGITPPNGNNAFANTGAPSSYVCTNGVPSPTFPLSHRQGQDSSGVHRLHPWVITSGHKTAEDQSIKAAPLKRGMQRLARMGARSSPQPDRSYLRDHDEVLMQRTVALRGSTECDSTWGQRATNLRQSGIQCRRFCCR